MKIKLSRNQWEVVGRKAGWIKTALNQDEIAKIKQKIRSTDLRPFGKLILEDVRSYESMMQVEGMKAVDGLLYESGLSEFRPYRALLGRHFSREENDWIANEILSYATYYLDSWLKQLQDTNKNNPNKITFINEFFKAIKLAIKGLGSKNKATY